MQSPDSGTDWRTVIDGCRVLKQRVHVSGYLLRCGSALVHVLLGDGSQSAKHYFRPSIPSYIKPWARWMALGPGAAHGREKVMRTEHDIGVGGRDWEDT